MPKPVRTWLPMSEEKASRLRPSANAPATAPICVPCDGRMAERFLRKPKHGQAQQHRRAAQQLGGEQRPFVGVADGRRRRVARRAGGEDEQHQGQR